MDATALACRRTGLWALSGAFCGLVAAGAVTGNTTSISELGRLIGYEEGLEEELRELEAADVVKLPGLIKWSGERTFNITLTEAGVRSMDAARTR